MSEDHEKTGRFELKTGLFSAAWSGKRMAEVITIASMFVLGIGVYVLWDMKKDNEKFQDQYIGAMKLISGVIEDNSIAQREFACVISVDQQDRKRAFTSGECRAQAVVGTKRGRLNGH